MANMRAHAQQREQVRRRESGVHVIGMLEAGLVQADVAESSHFVEDRILLSPGLVAVMSGLDAAPGRVGHIRIAFPNQHQARWIGVGKGLENHRVDDAENRGVGSDS